MCYFGVSSGGFWSLIPFPLVVHVHLLPAPHSEGKRKIVILLSEHGMSALGKSEELSGLLNGAAWIPSHGRSTQTPCSRMDTNLPRLKLKSLQLRTYILSGCPGCRTVRP